MSFFPFGWILCGPDQGSFAYICTPDIIQSASLEHKIRQKSMKIDHNLVIFDWQGAVSSVMLNSVFHLEFEHKQFTSG